jgi:hypothetical protein
VSDLTEVCLTVDTEFSIGGAFYRPTELRPIGEPHAYCPAEGKEHGLPFILSTLARFGFPATFFVETLNTAYFGDDPLRRIGDDILSAGQDLQLHLHPSWLHFRYPNWIERLSGGPPSDACSGRSLPEMETIIATGLKPFERFNWPRPIALRVGSLAADRTVFVAMSRTGLRLGSNIGYGGRSHPKEPALQVQAGRRWIDGVLEIPILCFVQFPFRGLKRYRRLTITGVGHREMISVLRAARANRISPIIVLTHPHEYVKWAPPGRPGVRPNYINKRRLELLCEFLADNSDQFVPVSFKEAGPRWLAAEPLESSEIPASILPSVGTLLQNRMNDLVKWI